jgi:hypothetical protein
MIESVVAGSGMAFDAGAELLFLDDETQAAVRITNRYKCRCLAIGWFLGDGITKSEITVVFESVHDVNCC